MAEKAKSETAYGSAYALQYRDPAALPQVVASGSGELAKLILQLAEEHQIPIEERGDLAELLKRVPQGAQIPEESLHIVAEVIAFLYHCNEQWAKHHRFVGKLTS
jgi:flagellar biosynthesis protein